MSEDNKHVFDPECPGCRPAFIDAKTGKPLPPDHETSIQANALWDELPYEEQEALHRVWVNNSRDDKDLQVLQAFVFSLQMRLDF